ncbi:hypothetical protein [Dietzia natronolimnaea]|uniref:hypothetical protein n=1 Tax=Dietzia natronolimnaea TaxID=161920 RepID=UPI0031F8CA4E
MRVAAAGLIALPVLVGGLGLAAAVVVLGSPEATAPSADEVAEEVAAPGSGGPVTRDGTDIEGSRPHLTVRSGMPSLMLAGTIPGFLALLPASVGPLPTLTPFGDATAGAGGPATGRPAGPAGPTTTVPSTAGSPAPTVRNPSPVPDPRVGSAPATGSGATAPRPTVPGGPVLLTIDPTAGPGTDAPATGRPQTDRTPPPHAAETGRPNHAGTTGPPPHASAHPRSDGALRDSSRSYARSSPE